jgi:hypothetical protein
MTEESITGPKRWISDSLLLGVLTAGAYWIAFRYETAYIKAFGFPIHLAEISLESILVVLLLLSGMVWSLAPFANLLAMFWPKHPALQVKLLRMALMIGLPIWHLINYGFRRNDLFFYIFMGAFIFVFEIIWPLFVFKDKENLVERFIADEVAEAVPRSRTLFGRVYTSLGPAGYGFVLLILIGGLLADSAGDAKAKNEKEYLVYNSDPSLAVVRLYHDRSLCIRIDREKREFDSISVRPSVDGQAELKKAKVGPLKESAGAHSN